MRNLSFENSITRLENKPLFGKKILITRAKEQSSTFMSKLSKVGAKPICCPIVTYEIIESEVHNKNIINNLSDYDWIFFTSQNAVKFFFEILHKNHYDSRALSKVQVAVVGYKTKIELKKYNIKVDFVPKRFSLKDLISELNEKVNLKGKKVLLPGQVGISRDLSLQTIIKWAIYKANFTDILEQEIIDQIKNSIDIITFFSSNTTSHFAKLIEKHNIQENLKSSLIAVIGEETSKTAKQVFGKVDIIADPSTEEGLISSMEKYFTK